VGGINIHRTYIPESELGPGILVHSYYEYKKSIPLITEMQVYYVDQEVVGKNISEELDIFCHLYLTKLVTEELSLI
jgi:hypothetical protein|tara:strand:+ start:544 stop:771 length:228 start_codon:yes stop_codon:yes gene_type:complete